MSKISKISKQLLSASSALQAVALISTGMVMVTVAATPAMAQDYTSGAITGTVVSEAGTAVSGATVVVTSVDQGFERTTTTSSDGGFRLGNLSAGSYNVEVKASGTPGFRAEGVNVIASQTQSLNIALTSSGEEIVVTGARISRDFNVATTGIVIDVANFVKDKPLGRDLNSVILLAPGTSQGDDGFGNLSSIGGSSVAENAYYVNGLNTTNFDNYLGSATIPFDFYRSVDVKSGGYPAEFGRATGGIVNAVSKSGGNDFTGAVHLNWAPNFLRSPANDLTNIDGSTLVSSKTTNRAFDRTDSYSAILEAGGPIFKDKLFVYGLIEFRENKTLRTSVPASLSTQRKNTDPFYAIKVDAYPIDNHHLEFTLFDTRNTETRTDFKYLVTNGVPSLGSSSAVTENKAGGLNFVGKYTGSLTDWLTVSGAYGRVRDRFDSIGVDEGSSTYRFANASGTTINGVANGGNFTPQSIASTDFPYNTERKFYRGDVDLFFNAVGDHHVRFGFDVENNTLEHVSIRNGGNILRSRNFLSPAAFNANLGGAGAFLIARPGNIVEVNYFNSGGGFEAQNKAFYIQDEWKVTDRLTLNLGVRRDDFALDKPGGSPYINLPKNYAPRIAGTYDLWENSNGRIFGSYSQYFLPVASNTAFRQASPELFIRERFNYAGITNGLPNITSQVTTLAAYQATCPFGLTTFSSGRNCNVTGDGTVKPTDASLSSTLKATKESEIIVGYKHSFGDIDLGISYTRRTLDSTAEDVAVDAAVLAYCTANKIVGCDDTWTGFHQYVIVNPGFDATFALAGLDGRTVTLSAADLTYPKAVRKYNAVEFTFDRKWDGNWSLGGSYTWSRSEGNSEGFVQSDFEQDDSGITQDFDQPGFTQGAFGLLPNHRTHRFKLFGSVAMSEDFTLGTNISVESPRPLSCFGFNPNPNYFDPNGAAYSDFGNAYGAASHYCNGKLSPRGEGLKTQWVSKIDLSARWNIKFGDRKVTLRGDVFNLLNSQAVQGRNEIGELDILEPNPNYGLASSYQAQRFVRLGADISF
jgi:outer membrane receptor protein involved in Fe transport